ncbi:hypothetical protein ACFLTB_02810 [Chloroflexota bacterium]
MPRTESTPDHNNCIETVVRKEYAAALNQLPKPGKEDKVLEEKLGVLRIFFETADFRQLGYLVDTEEVKEYWQ